MKLSTIVTVLVLTIVAVTPAWAVIEGTPHDVAVMRDLGAGSDIERCAMCHTPHSGAGQYPIWNRSASSSVSFDLYASPTFDMSTPTTGIDETRYATYNCLVCHNGVASTLVNYPGPGSPVNANYNFDDSLLGNKPYSVMTGGENDHPVSFTYDPTKDDEDNGFRASETYGSSGDKKAIFGARGTYPLYKYGTDYDQFECATCHAVHDTVDYPGKSMAGGRSDGTQVYFLRGDNSGSGMCKDCHVKR